MAGGITLGSAESYQVGRLVMNTREVVLDSVILDMGQLSDGVVCIAMNYSETCEDLRFCNNTAYRYADKIGRLRGMVGMFGGRTRIHSVIE